MVDKCEDRISTPMIKSRSLMAASMWPPAHVGSRRSGIVDRGTRDQVGRPQFSGASNSCEVDVVIAVGTVKFFFRVGDPSPSSKSSVRRK